MGLRGSGGEGVLGLEVGIEIGIWFLPCVALVGGSKAVCVQAYFLTLLFIFWPFFYSLACQCVPFCTNTLTLSCSTDSRIASCNFGYQLEGNNS